jgi:DNA-binding NtrC family response regulator
LASGLGTTMLGLWGSAKTRTKRTSSAREENPRALAIMRPGPERDALQAIFREADWDLAIAESLSFALTSQKTHPFPIVLWERELLDCDWHKAVSVLSGLPPRPWVILLSGHSDKNLWDDLTGFGGSDILRTPLDKEAVVRAIRSGWFLWRHLEQLHRSTRRRS